MKKLIILSIFISFITINFAYALNTSFMTYSASFYFTDEDWKIFNKTTEDTLNRTSDNVKVTWKNPNTGANGYFIPSNTSTQNGTRCRTLKVFNEAHHVRGESKYRFCFIKNEWKIVQ